MKKVFFFLVFLSSLFQLCAQNRIENAIKFHIFKKALVVHNFPGNYKLKKIFGDNEIPVLTDYHQTLLWNVHQNCEIKRFEGYFSGLSSNQKYLITNNTLWELNKKKKKIDFEGEFIAFSPDEKYFVTRNYHTIEIKQTKNGKIIYKTQTVDEYYEENFLAFSPDGKYFATQDNPPNTPIMIKQTKDGKIMYTTQINEEFYEEIKFLDFSPDSKKFFISRQKSDKEACTDPWISNIFYHIGIESGEIISTSDKILEPFLSISKNGKYVLIDKYFCDCNRYELYDIITSELVDTFKTKKSLYNVFFTDDSKKLITSEFIYNLENNKKEWQFEGQTTISDFNPNNISPGLNYHIESHNNTIIITKLPSGSILFYGKIPSFYLSDDDFLGFSNKENYALVINSGYDNSKMYIMDIKKISSLINESFILHILPFLYVIISMLYISLVVLLLIRCIKGIKWYKPEHGFSTKQKQSIFFYLFTSLLFLIIGYYSLVQFNFYLLPDTTSGFLVIASPFLIGYGIGLLYLNKSAINGTVYLSILSALVAACLVLKGLGAEPDKSHIWVGTRTNPIDFTGEFDPVTFLTGLGLFVYFIFTSTMLKKFEFAE